MLYVISLLAHNIVYDKCWCALFGINVLLFPQTTDTEGYDEYVEGVEPDETTSLETPIKEVILKLCT